MVAAAPAAAAAMRKSFLVPEIKPLDQYDFSRARSAASLAWVLAKGYGGAGRREEEDSVLPWGAMCLIFRPCLGTRGSRPLLFRSCYPWLMKRDFLLRVRYAEPSLCFATLPGFHCWHQGCGVGGNFGYLESESEVQKTEESESEHLSTDSTALVGTEASTSEVYIVMK
ncbi:UNVERIFIED_CONTAM: hypothetical protein K2H54_003097 [Gekko kuhli]